MKLDSNCAQNCMPTLLANFTIGFGVIAAGCSAILLRRVYLLCKNSKNLLIHFKGEYFEKDPLQQGIHKERKELALANIKEISLKEHLMTCVAAATFIGLTLLVGGPTNRRLESCLAQCRQV